jgi:Ca2+-dependent lipid-binding protein
MNMMSNYKSRGGVLGTTPENEPIGDDGGGGGGQPNQSTPTIDNHRTGSFGGLFSSKKENKPPPNSVNLLIEIVSATNLPIADLTSSDPYVCVEDGRTEWHRTGVISKSLNPVWTLSTGSLFLIQTTLNDFFEVTNRIEFIIKDYDSVGENDILGTVQVNKNELLAGEGERIDYELRTSQYKGKSRVFVGNKKVRSSYIHVSLHCN